MSNWLELSSSVLSQASDALAEAKQQVSQAISQKDLDPQNIDWSKISSNVLSRASDALTEAKQLVNQAASQGNTDLQNIEWSKLSVDVMSRASDALIDAKQLVDQTVSQKYLDLTNINWSKVSGNFPSHASSALTTARQMVNQVFIYHNWRSSMAIMSQQYQETLRPLVDVISSRSRNHWTKLWGSILSGSLFALTKVNYWSIMHPYVAAGALIFISAITNLGVFLTLLQLTGSIAVFLCLLPVQLIIRCFGFGSQGVTQGSFASRYQSSHYGGIVPRGSGFARLQSFGATMWIIPSTLISLLSYAGVAIVLGREWGWWLQ
jgi:hypothetical protein